MADEHGIGIQKLDSLSKFFDSVLDGTADLSAANAAAAKTGAQADAVNAAFGIQTDFANVPVVSDQGVTQSAAARRALETSGLF